MINEQKCPFCPAAIVAQCKCIRSDSKCAGGHEFHLCVEHPTRIVQGPSNHSLNTCSCVPGRTFEMRPVEVLL